MQTLTQPLVLRVAVTRVDAVWGKSLAPWSTRGR